MTKRVFIKHRTGRGLKYGNGMESGTSPLCRVASFPCFNRTVTNMEGAV